MSFFFVEDASIFDDALYKINCYWVGKMLGFVSLYNYVHNKSILNIAELRPALDGPKNSIHNSHSQDKKNSAEIMCDWVIYPPLL